MVLKGATLDFSTVALSHGGRREGRVEGLGKDDDGFSRAIAFTYRPEAITGGGTKKYPNTGKCLNLG